MAATAGPRIQVFINGVEMPPGSVTNVGFHIDDVVSFKRSQEIIDEIKRLEVAKFTGGSRLDRFAYVEYEDGHREYVAYCAADAT